MTSWEEQLLDRFYRWELRGRGWQVWQEPVELEPPFVPFVGHYVDDSEITDDGRKHTLISGAIDLLHRAFTGKLWASRRLSIEAEEEEPDPREWDEPDGGIVELQLSLPPALNVFAPAAEQLLLGFSACRHPVSFELIGLPQSVLVQFACAACDAAYVRGQVEAFFPEVTITTRGPTLEQQWLDVTHGSASESLVVELGLSREFMLPLAPLPRTLAVDPLTGMIAALADVGAGEVALLQVLFQPVRRPWAESVLRSVMLADGSALFENHLRDYVKQAREKISRPLYTTVVRIACAAVSEDDEGDDRVWELARRLCGSLAAVNQPDGNELIPLDNEGYEDADEHEQDLLLRRSRRSGMILSSDELVSLVHLPCAGVQVRKLRPLVRASAAAPSLVLNHRTVLGTNEHAGESRTVTLSPDQRAKHVHVIGASGTGKSTLLLNLILQDVSAGNGVAVLDPHGDLIDEVLRYVPRERVDDVILIDPADEDFPVGFNVLSAHSALEKNLLASDLVAVFRRLATSWGDQMTSVLGNAILALLENPTGGTLVDLRRFLVEPAFRKRFLASVTDQEVVYYWEKEFPLLTGRPQGPVLTRLDTFLRPKPIRHMVAQRESKLDFADILDNGRVLLARLSHGAIGAENAQLLGTLLVAKLHQMALGRQRMREEERRFFSLYIDEFHHFATPSMATILSGVRKYRLGLVLAHQEMQQLESVPEVAGALMSNAYTRVCFRLGDADAKKLETGFTGFEASDLQNLGMGEAICRVERAELSFNLKTSRPPAIDERKASAVREEVIAFSRRRYATPRAEVEAMLNRSRGEPPAEAHEQKSVGIVSRESQENEPQPERKTTKRRQGKVEDAQAPSSAPAPVFRESPAAASSRAIPPTPPASPPAAIPTPKPKAMGRGGGGHQHLQRLIKQWAEGLGYRAAIEEQVMGTRAADVALQKDGVSIAVELCMTTDFVHELGNVRKCLDAGFGHVIALSPDPDRLAKLRAVIEPQLEEAELERVRFFSPDELFAFVQEIELQRSGSETTEAKRTVRGYKVRTSFRPPTSNAEDKAKRQDISEVIAKSIKRRCKGEDVK